MLDKRVADASHFKTKGVTVVQRIFICAAIGFGLCLWFAGTVHAVNIRQLPPWVRQSIHPVYIDWAEVYPGLELGAALVPIEAGRLQTLGAAPLSVGEPRLEPIEGVGKAGSLLSAMLPEPARLHGGVLSILATGKDLIQQGKLNEETFPEWFAEHNIDQAALIDVLDGIPLSHPMDPIYLPICAVLWEQTGDDIEAYLEFPSRARITMGIYLGVLEREDDAKKLLASVSPADQKGICSGVAMYHVANELVAWRSKSPGLAIWAWKRGAEMQGAADQAFVCMHIGKTCRLLGDASMVREELIPWAEEALARPGLGSRWDHAIRELVWAYGYLGERQTAIEKGRYWVQYAREHGVSEAVLVMPNVRLAEMLAGMGQVVEAADILRRAVHDAAVGSWQAEAAQAALVRLAQAHPDIGNVDLLPGRFERLWPEKLHMSVRAGEDATRTVTLWGNPTFRITEAHCTVPSVRIEVQKPALTDETTTQAVALCIRPEEAPSSHDGKLVLKTNDATMQAIEVPLAVEILSPIVARPDSFFFGFVKPGETTAATITLTSTVPFEITNTKENVPDLMEIEIAKQGDNCYLVKASLHAAKQPGALKGNIELSTNLDSQPSVRIPYWGQVGSDE